MFYFHDPFALWYFCYLSFIKTSVPLVLSRKVCGSDSGSLYCPPLLGAAKMIKSFCVLTIVYKCCVVLCRRWKQTKRLVAFSFCADPSECETLRTRALTPSKALSFGKIENMSEMDVCGSGGPRSASEEEPKAATRRQIDSLTCSFETRHR